MCSIDNSAAQSKKTLLSYLTQREIPALRGRWTRRLRRFPFAGGLNARLRYDKRGATPPPAAVPPAPPPHFVGPPPPKAGHPAPQAHFRYAQVRSPWGLSHTRFFARGTRKKAGPGARPSAFGLALCGVRTRVPRLRLGGWRGLCPPPSYRALGRPAARVRGPLRKAAPPGPTLALRGLRAGRPGPGFAGPPAPLVAGWAAPPTPGLCPDAAPPLPGR